MFKFKKIVNNIYLLIFTFASSLASAEDTELLENNLQKKPQAKNKLNKDHPPLVINAELLWGRVIGDPVIAYRKDTNGKNDKSFDFENKTKLGFKLGLGFALQKSLNINLQYKLMRGGDDKKRLLTYTPPAPNAIYQLNEPKIFFLAHNVNAYSHQVLRYQTFDLLLQKTADMMSSGFCFQPFGGLRYMYYKRELSSSFNIPESSETIGSNSRLKIHSSGVLIGTDIKYILNENLYFFNSVMTGMLIANQSLKTYFNNSLSASPEIEFSNNSFNTPFSPFIELSFGFGWNHAIEDGPFLSFRLAYEISSFLGNKVNIELSENYTIIKTQAGVLRATMLF